MATAGAGVHGTMVGRAACPCNTVNDECADAAVAVVCSTKNAGCRFNSQHTSTTRSNLPGTLQHNQAIYVNTRWQLAGDAHAGVGT